MVSVSKIGQIFNTPTNFSANVRDKGPDKAKIKSFAQNQINMGYVAMGAGALPILTSLAVKNKALRVLSVIPAALMCAGMGSNMISSGSAIKNAVNKTEPQPAMDKKA